LKLAKRGKRELRGEVVRGGQSREQKWLRPESGRKKLKKKGRSGGEQLREGRSQKRRTTLMAFFLKDRRNSTTKTRVEQKSWGVAKATRKREGIGKKKKKLLKKKGILIEGRGERGKKELVE